MDSGVTEEIKAAMRLFHRGERGEARAALARLWEELPEEEVFHRCMVAHYTADTRDDLEEELEWDRRALELAQSVAPGSPGAGMVEAFLPSLHLNLADAYRRKSDFARARHHADRGIDLAGALKNDAYGRTVRDGLLRVDAQIADGDSGPGVIFDFD